MISCTNCCPCSTFREIQTIQSDICGTVSICIRGINCVIFHKMQASPCTVVSTVRHRQFPSKSSLCVDASYMLASLEQSHFISVLVLDIPLSLRKCLVWVIPKRVELNYLQETEWSKCF